ncbi:MAG: hypothetical protein JWM64_2458 [Frankiales bacterium]|nr:hypothetical protein [Frankiales bacterium]
MTHHPKAGIARYTGRRSAHSVAVGAIATMTVATGFAGTAPAAASTRSSSEGRSALAEAPDHDGKPYQWGAEGPSRFDCSGFTQYLFGHQGKELARTASAQYGQISKLPKSSKRPGDLIFSFDDGGIYHVGVYAGDGVMWAATHSGDTVRKQRMRTDSYKVGRVT